MPAQRADGAEVSAVEGEHHVDVVDGCEGEVHRVRKIQIERAVLSPNGLCDAQLLFGDFGDDNPAARMARWPPDAQDGSNPGRPQARTCRR